MTFSIKSLILITAIAAAQPVAASVVLFADSFDDELGDINGQPNASVSGTFAQTNANNYTGRGNSVYSETGGNGGINPNDTTSGMLISLWDFATDANVQSSGTLTVSLSSIVPSITDWLALNIITTIPASGNIFVNQGLTALGALFTPSGAVQVFSYGAGGAIANTWSDNDITFELTNITNAGTASGSFDYEIFSGASSLTSGSVSGNLSALYVGIESRESLSTFSELSITTVPEPTVTLLGACGLFGLVLRRRR